MSCNRRFPGFYMDKISGDGGFKITVVDANQYYTPGKSYEGNYKFNFAIEY